MNYDLEFRVNRKLRLEFWLRQALPASPRKEDKICFNSKTIQNSKFRILLHEPTLIEYLTKFFFSKIFRRFIRLAQESQIIWKGGRKFCRFKVPKKDLFREIEQTMLVQGLFESINHTKQFDMGGQFLTIFSRSK